MEASENPRTIERLWKAARVQQVFFGLFNVLLSDFSLVLMGYVRKSR